MRTALRRAHGRVSRLSVNVALGASDQTTSASTAGVGSLALTVLAVVRKTALGGVGLSLLEGGVDGLAAAGALVVELGAQGRGVVHGQRWATWL